MVSFINHISRLFSESTIKRFNLKIECLRTLHLNDFENFILKHITKRDI